jgi:type IV secretory pathway VirB4 component
VALNPFDTRRYGNANVGIFAASGGGKSFLMGALLLEAHRCGHAAVIIDPEGEHRHTVAAAGGTYILLGDTTSPSLNILEFARDDRGVVVDFIDTLCGGTLTPLQRATLDRIAEQVLHDRRSPTLSALLPALRRTAPDTALVVERLCRGPLGRVFDRQTSFAAESAFIGISLRALPDELIPAATQLLGAWLWRLVRDDPRRRHVVFDEVGAAGTYPPLRKLLIQLARRCRKYNASLVVATQNASDLLHNPDTAVIATNCAIAFLGGHRPAETAHMEHCFGLTTQQRAELEQMDRGSFLLLAGHRRVPVHIDVPESYRNIIEGRRTDVTG